jgi:acetyl esterase/lipase
VNLLDSQGFDLVHCRREIRGEDMMKCAKVLLLVPGLMLWLADASVAAEPIEISLWSPGALPKVEDAKPEQVIDRGKSKPDRSVSNVTVPTLTVYLPEGNQTGITAVVICPGGAYSHLAIDKEGHAVARWLNTIGVAGIVLKYRMPRPDLSDGQKPWPIQDGERAIRLVRSHAAEWKINPHRVGLMGFSAGGHLASTVGTHLEDSSGVATDAVEKLSTRPDFMVLAYPVISMREPVTHLGSLHGLLGLTPDPKMVELYSNESHVTSQTPRTFLVQARDDRVSVENSLLFYAALQKAGVQSELHVLEKGGHGFGLGDKGGEPAAWPALCAAWLKTL